MTSTIYLDNSATTRVRDEVVAAMQPYLADKWGNASSIHFAGRQSRQAIEKARTQVAKLINAKPKEIFFTPGGTVSNNMAILGRARFVEEQGLGRHIITTAIEHSSSIGPAKHLKERGWDVTILGVTEEGLIDLNALEEAIRPDTSIISIMWANNEVGSIQPVQKIAELAYQRGIFFHCDAVQAASRISVDVSQNQVSTLSLSGHKFYAPKGVGILFIRDGVQVLPLFFGGGQERGIFPGTESLSNIVAIGQAAELAGNELQQNQKHLRGLQEFLIKRLTRYGGASLTGPTNLANRIPGHVSLVITGIIGAELVSELSTRGVCISSVSACSSGGGAPSHVLQAIGLTNNEARGAVRITAGKFNTETECKFAAEIISDIIAARNVNLWSVLQNPAFPQISTSPAY